MSTLLKADESNEKARGEATIVLSTTQLCTLCTENQLKSAAHGIEKV